MSCGCDKIKGCSDVCNCITIVSTDGSVVATKSITTSGCRFDISTTPTTQVPFTASSASLTITPGGTAGHAPNIEIVPSTAIGNTLVLGGDGKPYVQGVAMANGQCISFQQSVVAGKLVYTPVIDWQCVAALICPLCTTPTCIQPGTLNIT